MYVTKKLSKKSIAKIYSCGITSIDRRLIEYNISARKTINYKISKKLDHNEIIKLYTKDNLNVSEIAKKCNVGRTPIRKILMDHNIKITNKGKIKHINKYERDLLVGTYTLNELCSELNKTEHNIYSYIKTKEFCWGFRWEIVYR